MSVSINKFIKSLLAILLVSIPSILFSQTQRAGLEASTHFGLTQLFTEYSNSARMSSPNPLGYTFEFGLGYTETSEKNMYLFGNYFGLDLRFKYIKARENIEIETIDGTNSFDVDRVLIGVSPSIFCGPRIKKIKSIDFYLIIGVGINGWQYAKIQSNNDANSFLNENINTVFSSEPKLGVILNKKGRLSCEIMGSFIYQIFSEEEIDSSILFNWKFGIRYFLGKYES